MVRDMLEGIEAVIFDLDGTLVDSMWMWKRIDIEYLERYGIELPERLQSELEGMSFSETAVYFKERFKIPESLQEIKDAWNGMALEKYTKEVPLKPGVEAFLKKVRERGIKAGIATSNSRELVEAAVEALGVRQCFDVIVTACDAGRGKPAPDIYLLAAKLLGVDREKCLVFEDIIPGIMAGLNAGMHVCAVEDDYSVSCAEEKRRLAHYYISDYSEIES